jgi:predicted ABC-type transport system involved in lysophospholipase L1 biosynthesis ATPase subunit
MVPVVERPVVLVQRPDHRPALLAAIARAFAASPELLLTGEQIGRLWDVEASTCTQLLDVLVADRFLDRRSDGAYSLAGP